MAVTGAVIAGAGLGYIQGENAKTVASYNREIGNANASMLEQQAERQIKIGEREAGEFRKQTNKTVGAQRAALAAQGVDVNSGSALDIQEETLILGGQDATRIKTNAYLEALGLKSQAVNLRFQGEFGEQSARTQQMNSIISGGIQGFTASGGISSFGSSKASGGMASGSTTATAGSSYKNYGSYA